MSDDKRLRVDDEGVLWLGDRAIRWAEVQPPMDYGTTLHRRQALIKLESGYELSIVWGSGSYSDNHENTIGGPFTEEPATVEVAIIDRDGEFVEVDGMEVFGYLTMEQVLDIIDAVSTWPSHQPGRTPEGAQ